MKYSCHNAELLFDLPCDDESFESIRVQHKTELNSFDTPNHDNRFNAPSETWNTQFNYITDCF